MRDGTIAVVVPALNESGRVASCLGSLYAQDARLGVFVSDNASDDDTADVVRNADHRCRVDVRRLDSRLEAAAHFVSAARWALSESDAELFAFLAADDEWRPGFISSLLPVLDAAKAGVAFPTFEWVDGTRSRVISPASFMHPDAHARQRAALLLPDWRELANLVYGVYERAAFKCLVDAMERGGDLFAIDYAAAWLVLGSYKAVACRDAVGVRQVRSGADLLERVGLQGTDGKGVYRAFSTYIRLTYRVNRGIADAIRQISPTRHPSMDKVLVLRLPQALWGISRQLHRLSPWTSD